MAVCSSSDRRTDRGVFTELVGGPGLPHAYLGRLGLWPFLVDAGDDLLEKPAGRDVAEFSGEPDVNVDGASIRHNAVSLAAMGCRHRQLRGQAKFTVDGCWRLVACQLVH